LVLGGFEASHYAALLAHGSAFEADKMEIDSCPQLKGRLTRFGLSEEIVLDDGTEGTSRPVLDWSERTGVRQRFIQPGKPVQNASVESFTARCATSG